MSIGWFDAFRDHGSPTWYGENRTPVVVDLQIAALLSLFLTPTIAYLIVSPGIRKHWCASTFTFLFSMAVGAILLVSIHYPCWQQGNARVLTTYRAFTTQRMNAELGVKIGLYNVNITLSNSISETERALIKGMPYPMLKVVEYLSMDRAGFNHGRQYRVAGYYTGVLLWCAFACWLLLMVLLVLLPRKYGHVCLTMGATTLCANLVYALNVPSLLFIPFPSPQGDVSVLEFRFSHCFYLTLFAGLASVLYGAALLVLQLAPHYQLRTIFSAKLACEEWRGVLAAASAATSSCSASSTGSSRCSEDGRAFDSDASTDRFSRVFDQIPTVSEVVEANETASALEDNYRNCTYENRQLDKCRSASQVCRQRPDALARFMDNAM